MNVHLIMIKMEYMVKKLLQWYKNNYRRYPWRNESSPYRIMIAEFMLQRTRANQVLPVYINFINMYQDIFALSIADIKDVDRSIESLGLKWRASHFKKAAEYIVNEYSGDIPSNKEDLLKVPGIGEYISGAILAVAFSKKSCIVDSNIARVLNRFFGLRLEGEIRRKKEIVKLSCELFNCEDPKTVLFAIIDFSASICTPLNPKHQICPLKEKCKFYKEMA